MMLMNVKLLLEKVMNEINELWGKKKPKSYIVAYYTVFKTNKLPFFKAQYYREEHCTQNEFDQIRNAYHIVSYGEY